MTVAAGATPFLAVDSFLVNEAEPPHSRAPQTYRSPFLSIYELDGEVSEAAHDEPLREAYALLMEELHDEELDEALQELELHARAMHDEALAGGADRDEAERLTQHFAQLTSEADAMVDAAAGAIGTRDEAAIVERELEAFFEAYVPSAALQPQFEDFLGKFALKAFWVVKSAASKAWKGIKTLGLGHFRKQSRMVARPLLRTVLVRALVRVRAPLQPPEVGCDGLTFASSNSVVQPIRP